MLKSLKQFIDQHINANNTNSEPSTHDIQLAASTLMFEVIRSDSNIDDIELTHMSALLERHFELDNEEIGELMGLAQESAEQAISLQGFTRRLCESWNNQQRCQLVENLWVIALADGKIDAHERHVIRKIAALLYLNDKQIIQAKESAKNSLTSH